MYFLNVNALARDLKENKVSEEDKTRYYFFSYLFNAPLMAIYQWLPLLYILTYTIITSLLQKITTKLKLRLIFDFSDYMLLLVPLLISIIGIIICYRINKKGDHKKFIERFISLSVPITINILLITTFIFLATGFITKNYFTDIYKGFLDLATKKPPLNPIPGFNIAGATLAAVKKAKMAKVFFRDAKTTVYYGFLFAHIISILATSFNYAWIAYKIKFVSSKKG